MGNDDAGVGHILYHLLIGYQFAPLAVLWFVCAEACLHDNFFPDDTVAFQLVHFLYQAVKRLFVGSYRYKYHNVIFSLKDTS